VVWDFVLRKDEGQWVRRCLIFATEGIRHKGRPKQSWKEVVDSDLEYLHVHASDTRP